MPGAGAIRWTDRKPRRKKKGASVQVYELGRKACDDINTEFGQRRVQTIEAFRKSRGGSNLAVVGWGVNAQHGPGGRLRTGQLDPGAKHSEIGWTLEFACVQDADALQTYQNLQEKASIRPAVMNGQSVDPGLGWGVHSEVMPSQAGGATPTGIPLAWFHAGNDSISAMAADSEQGEGGGQTGQWPGDVVDWRASMVQQAWGSNPDGAWSQQSVTSCFVDMITYKEFINFHKKAGFVIPDVQHDLTIEARGWGAVPWPPRLPRYKYSQHPNAAVHSVGSFTVLGVSFEHAVEPQEQPKEPCPLILVHYDGYEGLMWVSPEVLYTCPYEWLVWLFVNSPLHQGFKYAEVKRFHMESYAAHGCCHTIERQCPLMPWGLDWQDFMDYVKHIHPDLKFVDYNPSPVTITVFNASQFQVAEGSGSEQIVDALSQAMPDGTAPEAQSLEIGFGAAGAPSDDSRIAKSTSPERHSRLESAEDQAGAADTEAEAGGAQKSGTGSSNHQPAKPPPPKRKASNHLLAQSPPPRRKKTAGTKFTPPQKPSPGVAPGKKAKSSPSDAQGKAKAAVPAAPQARPLKYRKAGEGSSKEGGKIRSVAVRAPREGGKGGKGSRRGR